MILVLLFALFWAALASWRIRVLIRFFQLEEYQSARYIRWLVASRHRAVPDRFLLGATAGFAVAGILLVVGLDAAALHLPVWLVAGAVIAWPEPAKEVKKRFVATQRATRLLVTAWAVAILWHVGFGILVASQTDAVNATTLEIVALAGLAGYVLAPLALPVANVLMYPVEETFRRGFREKARRRLARARPLSIIGITGSYGKTSTKDYIAHLLSGRHKVLATPKSYNTLMGVCITINNNLDPDGGYEYFIVEMGAYIPGEIARICKLTRPDISVVTAVGPQHLERFKTLDNIVIAKYEIVENLPPDGTAIFNWDDLRVQGMGQRGYPAVRYGVSREGNTDDEVRLAAEDVQQTLDGLRFRIVDRATGESHDAHTPLVGLHNVTNILLAAMVALHAGIPLREIALRIASLAPTEHRLRRMKLPNGIVLLDDAYNTNPVGAVSALEVLNLHQTGRRVLVTPGMVELGPLHDQENETLGRVATQYCTDIVLVGKAQTAPIQRGVRSTNFDPACLQVVDTVQEAIDWYQRELSGGDAILFLNDLADNYLT